MFYFCTSCEKYKELYYFKRFLLKFPIWWQSPVQGHQVGQPILAFLSLLSLSPSRSLFLSLSLSHTPSLLSSRTKLAVTYLQLFPLQCLTYVVYLTQNTIFLDIIKKEKPIGVTVKVVEDISVYIFKIIYD